MRREDAGPEAGAWGPEGCRVLPDLGGPLTTEGWPQFLASEPQEPRARSFPCSQSDWASRRQAAFWPHSRTALVLGSLRH